MKQIVLLIFLLSTFILKAQEVTPELVTDRPDQTESSSVVPLNSLQIETGFLVEKDETNLASLKSRTWNSTLLRYGFLPKLELRLGLELLQQEVTVKNPPDNLTYKGFGPLYTGFKVKLADEQGWRPETAFLGGLILPFTANDDFKPAYTAADMRLAFSHSLSPLFSLGYNLGVEWDGESAIPGYFYSLALGIGITGKLSAFAESYGLIPEAGSSEHLLDAGITYLLQPNLQLDFSAGFGLNGAATDHFVSLGLSYRLPPFSNQ